MNRIVTYTLAGVAVLTMMFGTGCDKLKSRDRINQGIQAYKNAKYQDAIDDFKSAIALDPTNPNAKVYLATAYMAQWIPGAESQENAQLAKAAKDELLDVLKADPKNTVALAYLAQLAYNQAGSLQGDAKIAKFDEARDWNLKLTQADPKNAQAFYSLGVIAWAKWYPALMKARADLGMKPEDPGPIKDKKVKEELKAKYSATIQEGIDSLKKALDADPQYDDAMAYLNLLIRERADLADSPQEYKQQIEVADQWVQKALDTKKAKAAKAAQTAAGGITADK